MLEAWQKELLTETVAASNRTTHAVRAIVRFLFIQLAASTVAILILLLGSMTQNGFLSALGLSVLVAGVIAASVAGWGELKKSEVPERSPALVSRTSREEESQRKVELLSSVERALWEQRGMPNLYYWNETIERFEDWISHYKAD